MYEISMIEILPQKLKLHFPFSQILLNRKKVLQIYDKIFQIHLARKGGEIFPDMSTY